MITTNLLSVSGLTISFQHNGVKNSVVKDIGFSVNRGETLAIVGESGSGKSVSAMAIMRLLPQPAASIDGGEILFNGENLLDLNDQRMQSLRGRKIAAIFQEPMTALNPVQTVGTQLAEVLHIHQPTLSVRAVQECCLDLLEQVEIPAPTERLKQYPHELSGGMRQRVMIAMAIACEPALLIADEPTTALDVTIQLGIMQLLKRLQTRLNMGMILISHDLALVRHYADTVAVMHRGQIVEQASCKALFDSPQQPYTQQLLSAFTALTPVEVDDNSERLISVDDLSVKFPLKKGFFGQTKTWLTAVDRVSFDLRKGHTVGIVGESGSGKSTLVKALLRLIPSSGVIYLGGQKISTLSASQMRPYRADLQVVLQDPYGSLSPRMTIEHILLEPLNIHTQLSGPEKRAAVAKVLAEVGIDVTTIQRYPHEFSGGQRQRIAIARALILAPAVLVLDEPTSALDKTVQIQIISLLKSLQQQRNLSYVFISHDLQVIKAISHHVLVMKDGVVVEQGATQAVLTAPQHEYTRSLLDAAFY